MSLLDQFNLTGAQIKKIRLDCGLSQQDFGARLGVTHAHISKIENGKENPSETLLRLIQYEFQIRRKEKFPDAEETKPRVRGYLATLDEMLVKESLDAGCLFACEYILSALVTILRETKDNYSYQGLLLDTVGGIIDEVAIFVERCEKRAQGTDNVYTSNLKRAQSEIMDLCDSLISLLGERAK